MKPPLDFLLHCIDVLPNPGFLFQLSMNESLLLLRQCRRPRRGLLICKRLPEISLPLLNFGVFALRLPDFFLCRREDYGKAVDKGLKRPGTVGLPST